MNIDPDIVGIINDTIAGDVLDNQQPSLLSMARQLGVASHVFCKFIRIGNPEVS